MIGKFGLFNLPVWINSSRLPSDRINRIATGNSLFPLRLLVTFTADLSTDSRSPQFNAATHSRRIRPDCQRDANRSGEAIRELGDRFPEVNGNIVNLKFPGRRQRNNLDVVGWMSIHQNVDRLDGLSIYPRCFRSSEKVPK